MTEIEVLKWIKVNLSAVIQEALKSATIENYFSEEWLAAIACRETTVLIIKYAERNMNFSDMCMNMKGDFTNNTYHGFSFWQIDIRSFRDFIESGDWRFPVKACKKAIEVLEGKAKYLGHFFSPGDDVEFKQAVTAAYNCGEGNVARSIKAGEDVDTHTAHGNYSKDVFRLMNIYKGLS